MRSRRPPEGTQRGPAIAVLTLCALIGTAWLVLNVVQWRDRADVMGRGTTVNAEVLSYRPGSVGASDRIGIRFVTADGEEIFTDVLGPPPDPQPRPGDRLRIRYDPSAPHRVEPVDGSEAVSTFLIYIVGGAALVGMSVFGIWWWGRDWWRDHRGSRLVLHPVPRQRAAPHRRPAVPPRSARVRRARVRRARRQQRHR